MASVLATNLLLVSSDEEKANVGSERVFTDIEYLSKHIASVSSPSP